MSGVEQQAGDGQIEVDLEAKIAQYKRELSDVNDERITALSVVSRLVMENRMLRRTIEDLTADDPDVPPVGGAVAPEEAKPGKSDLNPKGERERG